MTEMQVMTPGATNFSMEQDRAAFVPTLWCDDSRALLTVTLVGIILLVPMMVWGIPEGGDLANHFRFAQPFYDSIRTGHLYPGWLAESNYGFGDARFRFYPPGLYYLIAVFKSVSGWYWASIFTFAFLNVLGGLGAYFWARGSYSARVAMWAGVLYTIAPYHLNQIYQASLLSEYAACSILPFLFAFSERVCRRGGLANVGGLALSLALLVLTHLPLTVIGSLAVALYVLLCLQRERFWSTVLRLGLGVGLALVASSFFWTTVLVELPWIKGNSANQNIYYDYRVNFLFSPAALTNRNTWYANLLGLAVLGMLLPAVVLLKKKTADATIRSVALLTLVSFLMATEISRPLWFIIPKLREVQFPWRWLTIVSLGASILVPASLPRWRELWQSKFRPLHLLPILGCVLSLFFVATQVVLDSDYLSRAQFDSFLQNIRSAPSFKDWMPIWAGDNIQTYVPSDRVIATRRQVSVVDWQPEHRRLSVGAGEATEARIRTFYYPLWTANTKDGPLGIRPAPDGAMLVSVPAQAMTINLDFHEPPRVRQIRTVSLIGWLGIAALFVSGFRRRRTSTSISTALL